MFVSSINEDLGQDWKGKRNDSADGVGTVLTVTFLSTKAVALKVFYCRIDGFLSSDVGSNTSHDVNALLTGPITRSEDGVLAAVSKHATDIGFNHEMSVDAGSHVAEPHVHTGLTASGIRSLWAYKGSDESFLFLYTLIRQKMLNKSS